MSEIDALYSKPISTLCVLLWLLKSEYQRSDDTFRRFYSGFYNGKILSEAGALQLGGKIFA